MATILIIDDLPANRKILVTLLRAEGHRLLEAADGREGLALAHAERPDLVITDILMPVMDGYEFVRQLRLDPAIGGTPVVFYTAHYGEREARALAVSSGALDVVTKPAEPPDVLRVVRRALGGAAYPSPPADPGPMTPEFDRDHLRLLTDKLSEKADGLRAANARLRALVNIGLELAAEWNSDRLIDRVCLAARDLFGATYVTLGTVDPNGRTVQHAVTLGSDGAPWIGAGDAVPGILATAAGEGRAVRGENAGGDPAALGLPVLHPKIHAFVAAPVASPTRTFGWLCLVGNEGRPFTEDDEHLLVALAGQLGRTFEGRSLAALAQKRAEDLEREIREREQAEAAMRVERDRAKRYLNVAETILLALDLQGRITLVNRYACSVFGWTAEELLGRDFIDTCVPAQIRDETKQKLATVLDGPDTSIVENAIVTRSGDERMIEWRNTLIKDEAGRVVSTLSSGTDRTASRQAEKAREGLDQQLRDQQFYARSLIESSIDALMTTDPQGTITDVNRQAEVLTGYARTDLIGTPFSRYFTEPERAEAGIRQVLSEDTVTNYELIAVGRDGGLTAVSYNATTFHDRGGDLQGVFVAARDVTELKRFDEALRQKNMELEDASRLKSEFLANMSHELRTPLNAIIGFSEVLRDGLLGELSDQQRKFIGDIYTSGTHLLSLINDVLDLSKIEAGRMTLDLQELEVPELFANSLSIVREMAQARHVRVDMDVTGAPGSIVVDPRKVKQIVYNLLSNGVKFTGDDGHVTLRLATVSRASVGRTPTASPSRAFPLAASAFGEFLEISVTDTGVGISPDGLARLFLPFNQIDTGLVRRFEGTGLGLVMVKNLAELHGGTVAVASDVGTGSSFTVWLPLRPPAKAVTVASGAGAVGASAASRLRHALEEGAVPRR